MTMLALLQRLTSPPMQKLRTLQPTSSTIKYTVSTRPVPESPLASLVHDGIVVTRVLIGIVTVVSLWAKWRITSEKPITILQWLLGDVWEEWLLNLIESCEWRYLAPSAICLLFLVLRRGYTEESLTLLRGVGIQTSTSSSTYLLGPTTRFIPTTNIQDMFIIEAFKGFEVIFYLAIVVNGEEDVVVVFPKLLPRRAILEVVWRGARSCLWEGKGVGENKGYNTREVRGKKAS